MAAWLRENGGACERAQRFFSLRVSICEASARARALACACQRGEGERLEWAWRKCRSSLGHVDGGGGTSEAPGPHGTSLPSPPRQTGSIWALSAPLAPADSDLYDGGEERSALDQAEGKI